MDEAPRRNLFAGLATLAAVALVGAAVAWLLAVPNAGVWIIACLVVLVVVVGVEVYLLTTMRKDEPMDRAPDPHRGPGADDEIMDFIIDES